MLYSHGIGSILVSAAASSGLAFISREQLSGRSLAAWWLCMMLVLILRGVDILHFRRVRSFRGRRGRLEVRQFAVGVIAAALLWAVFPIAFLHDLDLSARAYTIIVLCGMAGGSATVLAPSKTIAALFCALLVLPISVLLLSFSGPENTFFGILGCAFFVVMYASSRVTNRAAMTAVRLSRANEVLVSDMERERRRTEAANLELKTAQAELSDVNRFLESRIRERTSDLEKEMREKEHYAKELAYLASTDSLTGLCNRATLAKRLSAALSKMEAEGRLLAVLFLDLDRFKEVNDLMGHLAGDWVLQAVAQRLLEHVPPQVELARWGGDEFVVALGGLTSTETAMELANDLSTCLHDPIRIDSTAVRVDVTIGIALFPDHGHTEEDLIRAADMAMYASKQEKRAKVRLFDPALSQRLTERHLLERALRNAIDTRTLEVAFQPILTSSTGECDSFEALARWNHPERGFVSPTEFIALAEKSGDIAALGRAILTKACQEAALWQGARARAVSVNVSAVQLESGSLLTDIAGALESARLPASCLQLELTETVFAGDRSEIIPTLRQLREMGVKVSLDDFGTGFSCLADLRRLPIDQLKIDKSFVESMDTDSGAIVKAIVTTAQTFGLEVVAEGVETPVQAQKLTEMGVQYLQGYLFSGILSADAARDWVRERHSDLRAKMAFVSADC